MPTVTYNPKSAERAYLPHEGIYGPGQEYEADVTIFAVGLAEPGSLDAPFSDKECQLDTYTVWQFRVTYQGMLCFVRSRAQANTLPNAGSKNLAWLANLKVSPTTQDENGFPAYDLDKLSGLKCAIRVGKPRRDREDASVWYSGPVLDVFGA
jgi:hypothetical protein